MQVKYNQGFLDKLEKITTEAGYILRYERGNFQSGYCILEEKKVVVLNKFLQLEGRVTTLVELIGILDIEAEQLSEPSKKLYLALQQPVPPEDETGN